MAADVAEEEEGAATAPTDNEACKAMKKEDKMPAVKRMMMEGQDTKHGLRSSKKFSC